MSEQIYNDLKNALSGLEPEISQAFDKLGESGQISYNIVKQRVIAESVITLVAVVIVFIAMIVISRTQIIKNLYVKESDWFNDQNRVAMLLSYLLITFAISIASLGFGIVSLTNLISVDYATINKIVDLAKNFKF